MCSVQVKQSYVNGQASISIIDEWLAFISYCVAFNGSLRDNVLSNRRDNKARQLEILLWQ